MILVKLFGANRSQSLICPEWSEGIAHSRSFDLSDERMSKFPTLIFILYLQTWAPPQSASTRQWDKTDIENVRF